MTVEEFRTSVEGDEPGEVPAPLAALWWDAKGDWSQAHRLVDDLETKDGMAVHAYLHRREGDAGNAVYWYRRAGVAVQRGALEEEWVGLVERLLVGGGLLR
jgi:hypothetical protein